MTEVLALYTEKYRGIQIPYISARENSIKNPGLGFSAWCGVEVLGRQSHFLLLAISPLVKDEDIKPVIIETCR